MNQSFAEPLVASVQLAAASGGGAELTPLGEREVLKGYRAMVSGAQQMAVAGDVEHIRSLLVR